MSESRRKNARAKLNELAPASDIIEERERSIDVYELLLKFLDKWRWIALCALLGAILTLGYTVMFVTPKYKATAKIYVVNSKDSVVNLSDLQISNYLAQDYIEVFQNWQLHEAVRYDLEERAKAGDADALKLDLEKYSYSNLGKMITITNPTNTRILYITITSTDKEEARILANTYANVGKEFIANRMDTNPPTIFEEARTPTTRSSPSNTRNTIIGFVIGMLLAIVVITLRYLVDDYVRTADDVEKYLHLPTLGTIMLQKQSDDEGETHTGNKKKGESKHGADDE